ncbi:glycosyltransferase family 4 protein [Actinobacillus equuli]|uniref:glycosyltransferase family 4 protein n=1 Tax=Actinobacillus equuli TaxID=718 RepID=UPI0024181FD1|nr:glycosyltransferase family 4 protein [Actinobacillus equuli]MDG4953476.1 glycosyltransferase family 4 protein [Actinobacillus equuli subsp. equuli]
MKILFIVNGLSEMAGTERVVCLLANLFSQDLGYEITIVNRKTDGDSVAYTLNNSIVVHRFSGNYLQFYLKLNKFIKEEYFDHILVHNMGKLALLCSLLKIPLNTKLCSLEHSSFISRPLWIRILSKILYKKFYNVISLTKADEKCYKKYNCNVITINNISPYSVEINNLEYDIFSKKIIAIGRLVHEKNFMALLKAWSLIFRKYPEWTLEIYGKGEEEILLNDYIKINHMYNVKLCGIRDNLSSVYADAAFLVMTSRYEGLGLVLIEAQSFHIPLIAFDCPYGPATVIEHNRNGLLVQNQNIEQLALAMESLILSPEKRLTFSENSKVVSKKYQKEHILSCWKDYVFEK